MALDYIMSLFTEVMHGLRVYPERMMSNIESTRGVIFSQRVLLALIEQGLSREKAYAIVQNNAMRSWDEGLDFRQLIEQEVDVVAVIPTAQLGELFDYGYYVKHVDETFARAGV